MKLTVTYYAPQRVGMTLDTSDSARLDLRFTHKRSLRPALPKIA